jgi:hypothetical protein
VGAPVVTRDVVERLIAEQRRCLVELLECVSRLERTHHPIEATQLYDRFCFLRDDAPLRADRILACLEELDAKERRDLFRWQFDSDTDVEALMEGISS